MWTKDFWLAALERAVKTFAQTLAALLTGGATGILEVDWAESLSVAGLAAAASLLTSIGSSRIGSDGPSLTTERVE